MNEMLQSNNSYKSSWDTGRDAERNHGCLGCIAMLF